MAGYNPYVIAAAVKTYPDQLIGVSDVRPLIELIRSQPLRCTIAIDTETTGLFPYEDDVIRGVSIAFMDENIHSFYIPVGYDPNPLSTQSIQEIFHAIRDRDPYLILHHGKFDFAFLRQLPRDKDGSIFFPFPTPENWWDTKIVAWLLDENMETGLKPQAEFHWGIDQRAEELALKKLMRQKVKDYTGPEGPGTESGWGLLNCAEIAPYAAKDAELTLRLFHLQCELLEIADPPIPQHAIERELHVQATLHRMEQMGILVNAALLDSKTEIATAQLASIEGGFQAAWQEAVHATYKVKPKGFILNSPAQVARLLYDILEIPVPPHAVVTHLSEIRNGVVSKRSPGRSVSRGTLEALQCTTDDQRMVVKHVLEHRRLKKAMTGYLVPLKARIGRDGRIHAGFKSTGTVTGRFSCSNPNLQTIPRSDTLAGIRDLFVPEDGFELWGYDLSAAEMRVIAGMAEEEVLISSITEGRDMHGELAAEVFGPNWTPLQRRFAKNLGYGWFYGLTSLDTAVKYISGPNARPIAKKILDGLKARYKKVYRLMQLTTREACDRGFVPINAAAWPGRYRRFVTQSKRRPAPYTALNAQVQGGIGEFMKDILIVSEPLIDAIGARICLQVHDELVVEVPEGLGLKVRDVLQAVADDVNPFAMPMVFDAKGWHEHE